MDTEKVKRLSDRDIEVIKFIADNPYSDAKAVTAHLGNKSNNYSQLNKLVKHGLLKDHRDNFYRRFFSVSESVDLAVVDKIIEDEKRRVEEWHERYKEYIEGLRTEGKPGAGLIDYISYLEELPILSPEFVDNYFQAQIELLKQDANIADIKSLIQKVSADIQSFLTQQKLSAQRQAKFNDSVSFKLQEFENFIEGHAQDEELFDERLSEIESDLEEVIEQKIPKLESELEEIDERFTNTLHAYEQDEAEQAQTLATKNAPNSLSFELQKLDQLAQERSDRLEELENALVRISQALYYQAQAPRSPTLPVRIPEFNESWPTSVKERWLEVVLALANKA